MTKNNEMEINAKKHIKEEMMRQELIDIRRDCIKIIKRIDDLLFPEEKDF